MTIKHLGGIFGRNPTFNDAEVDGDLTVTGESTFYDNIYVRNDTAPTISIFDSNGGFSAATLTSQNGGRDLAIFAPQDLIFNQDGLETARFRDGGGLCFNGDTAAANALDDYEEGVHQTTMTPGTSGTVTLNTSYDELQYTKIGNMVNVRGHIITDAVSSPVGSFVNISLPFAAVSGAGKRAGGAVHTYGIGSNVYATYPAHIADGSSSLAVFLDASTLTASDQITISFCYQSA